MESVRNVETVLGKVLTAQNSSACKFGAEQHEAGSSVAWAMYSRKELLSTM
jgi:hypothetical protein